MTDQLAPPAILSDDLVETTTPEPADETTDRGQKSKRTSGRRRSTGRAAKPSVRRIAEKAEEISSTATSTRTLIAEILGAPSAGIADLTTAIMESKKSPVEAAVADLTIIQGGSIPEAVVHLVGMTRPDLQALHQLVSAFSDVDLPEKIPAKTTDAAIALVDPVRAADIDQASLEDLVQLLSK